MKMKFLVILIFFVLNFTLCANVIESLTPNGFATAFSIRKDELKRFEFRIDTPADKVKVKITPKKFSIIKGCKYYVEPTIDRPFEVVAQADGQLILEFSDASYQYIGIWKAPENIFPAKLKVKSEKSSLGSLTLLDDKSFIFERNETRGIYKVNLAENITLTPGKKYRFTFDYFSPKMSSTWKGFAYVALNLKSESGETKRVRKLFSYNSASKVTFAYVNFTVPGNWKTAKAACQVASEFPISAKLGNFEIRQAVEPMRNHPRHHGTATMYHQAISEKNLLKKLEARKPYEVKIARYAERPVLEINGKQYPFTGYCGSLANTAAMFEEAGFPVQWCSLPLASLYRYRKQPKLPVWLGKDKYNFDNVDKVLKNRLIYTPDQPLMITISLYPYLGFTDEFPDAAWRTADGKKLEIETRKNKYFHSFTGEIYRREVGKTLRKLGEHLKKSPYGKNIIGFHLGDGGDGQWFSWQVSDWQNYNFNYSPESRKELISHIRKLYKNDINKLRKAWQIPNAQFDTLEIPKPAEWKKYFNTLLNPAVGEQKRLIDWALVYEDALVTTIDYLFGELKAGLGRNAIGTVYFPHDSTSSLIRSKNIDGIVNVPFYHSHRVVGSSNFIEQPAGSFRINNKFLLTEMDHRSNYSELGCRVGGYDRDGLGVPRNIEDFYGQIRRDYALSLTQGGYAWLLTIAGYNTWSEKYYNIIPECLRAAKQTLNRPSWYDWGNIAFIRDFKAKRYSGRSYAFEYNHDRMPRKAIMESGVSYNDYLVEDIGNGRLKDAKIYIFANNSNLSLGQIAYIKKHYQKNGNVLVFTFGTAWGTQGGFEKNIKELTGFTVKSDVNTLVNFQYAEKKSNDPLAKGFGQIHVEKGEKIPLFYVDDKSTIPLAWHDSKPNLVAAAVKRHKDWTSIYLANGYFSPEFPRALAKEAKVIPTGPLGDVTLAGNSIIMLHAVTSGIKTVNLPKKGHLIDLTNGQICAYNCSSFSFYLKAGQTRWFKVR